MKLAVPFFGLVLGVSLVGCSGHTASDQPLRAVVDGQQIAFDNGVTITARAQANGRVLLDLFGAWGHKAGVEDDGEALGVTLEIDPRDQAAGAKLSIDGTSVFPAHPSQAGGASEPTHVRFADESRAVTNAFVTASCFCPSDGGEAQTLVGTLTLDAAPKDRMVGTFHLDLNGQIPYRTHGNNARATIDGAFDLPITR